MTIETMEVYGKGADGNEAFLGTFPVTPEMKAKEIVRGYGLDPDSDLDYEGGCMLGALYDMIAWMKAQGWTPPAVDKDSARRRELVFLLERRNELTTRLEMFAGVEHTTTKAWATEISEIDAKLRSTAK